MRQNLIKVAVVVLALVSVACGRAAEGAIEPQYQKYVDLFEDVARREGLQIEVRTNIRSVERVFIGDKEYVAECDNFNHTISVSQKYWKESSDAYKTSVIFHELGHCELGRDHDDSKLPNGAPASVMNPSAPSGSHYATYVDYYNYELFHNGEHEEQVFAEHYLQNKPSH